MWPDEIVTEGQMILDSISDINITPPRDKVLNFLKIPPKHIRVIILGQDPYPTKGYANGFAFSTSNSNPTPASLQSILKEVKNIQGYIKTDKTLVHWIKQGFLLLNTSLTTIEGISNQHSHYWKIYIEKIIKFLDTNYPNIIWMLWGNHAKSYKKYIKNGTILEDAHPSPLSQTYRKGDNFKQLKKLIKVDL